MEMQMPHYLPKWESLKKQHRLQNHGTPVCPSHTNGPEANTSSSISKYRPSLSPHSSISSPCSWRGTRVGVSSSVFDSYHIEVSNLVRTSSILPQQSNPISQIPIWLPPKYLLFLDMAYDPTWCWTGHLFWFHMENKPIKGSPLHITWVPTRWHHPASQMESAQISSNFLHQITKS